MTFSQKTKKLMCRFCNHAVNWENKTFITSHIRSEAHNNARRRHFASQERTRQQSLETVVSALDAKKAIIFELLKAWVSADIPIEKIDKMRDFFRTYCREGGSIPSASTLRKQYLGDVFNEHLNKLKEEFANKPISIIIDETTDVRARSIVNVLFNYQNKTKLVSVNFLDKVNNVTIGQLVLQLLIEWSIPFNSLRLFVSDSAAYMKKCVRDVLSPVMPQVVHNPCSAHILHLISEAFISNSHFDIIKN